MSRNNREMTIVVPNLSRSDALEMKQEFVDLKNSIAPNARASIAIGKKDNFSNIADRCIRLLKG